MANAVSLNHLQALLDFPFRQPNGLQKLVIGSALSVLGLVVPLVPTLLVLGHHAALARRAIRAGELELPEWTDWGTLLLDGLKLFGVFMVFLLPAFAVMALGFGAMMSTSVMAAIMEEAGPNEVLRWMWVPLLGSLAGTALFGLGFLLVFVAIIFAPVAVVHMIATDNFAAAFRVGQWWPILRANLGGFVLAAVLIMGVATAFSLTLQFLYFTIVLCCLVPLAAALYSMYVGTISAAVFGLAYREGVEKLVVQSAPPASIAPAPPLPAPPSPELLS